MGGFPIHPGTGRLAWPVVLGVLALGFARTTAGDNSSWTKEERNHWAFQVLSRPAVPAVKNKSLVRTAIDAFLLAKLEDKGLSFAPEADRRTLIRRVSFDLLGLPPSPEEVEEFVQSASADAYEKMLDRFLASPHFGERWGRHWLDGAGYVDVMGTDNDAGPLALAENKWRYRDYVVRAFNQDKPFDRFLTEQLAGDELVDWRQAPKFTPEIQELLIATGFLRTAADDTDAKELNTPDIRYGVLQRTLEVVGSNLLGLTLACAKCHDHKYEPIAQKDYYQFQALFQPAFNPQQWLPPKERQIADLSPMEKVELEKTKPASKKPAWSHLQAVYDTGPPTATHLLKRGNHLTPGKEVQPAFLSILSLDEQKVPANKVHPQGKTSGRRLALAHWLTQPNTPAASLVLRVRLNRTWHHLFGQGLVASNDNFGLTGSPPTHPELLNWLAAEFLATEQRLKPMLKLIMSSSAYRQASALGPNAGSQPPKTDPDNHLLWRMRLRRLESESIRDTLLTVSGKLDRTLGGPPLATEARPDGMVAIRTKDLPTSTSPFRRSLYLAQRRNYHPTLLNVFDQPNLTTNCTGRTTSAVVLQTLTMLNDNFVLEQAGFLAERVEKEAKPTPEKRIETAFLLVLGRPPQSTELTLSRDFLQQQMVHYQTMKLPADQAQHKAFFHLCHMLLNTSEFLYIP